MRKLLTALFLLSWFSTAQAATPPRNPNNISDWYIHSFEIDISVNSDSSVSTTETIIADAGNLSDKHGIFVIIPTRTYLTSDTYLEQPIYNVKITDENGQTHPFTISQDKKNHTETYKIGDPNLAVSGLNTYVIKFDTANALRKTDNKAEFYWDIFGEFWTLPVDNYRATIHFPAGFDINNMEDDYYGLNSHANHTWIQPDTLQVESTSTLSPGTGLTISVTMPPELFTGAPNEGSTDYTTSWWWGIWWMIIPLAAFVILYPLWKKHGDDPNVTGNNVLVPEFDIPKDTTGKPFDPISLGLILNDGNLQSTALSAAIINLAVKGYITIEQIESKTVIFKKKDYTLKRTNKSITDLSKLENLLLEKLFGDSTEVKLSDLRNQFYTKVASIEKKGTSELVRQNILESTGKKIKDRLFEKIKACLFGAFILINFFGILFINSGHWGYTSIILTILVLIIFAAIMPRRPEKGWILFNQIKGFKHYMKTAEEHRQQFFEKQGMWERLLPYAILFGLTGIWAKILKQLAAEDTVYAGYNPVWWYGGNFAQAGQFDVNDFATQLNTVSSAIGTSMTSSPSSSGTGGGGFSGGGGGGGGGGGW